MNLENIYHAHKYTVRDFQIEVRSYRRFGGTSFSDMSSTPQLHGTGIMPAVSPDMLVNKPPPPQILLVGDSITQGAFDLQSHLATHYSRRFDILNRGLGGYNSTSVFSLFQSFFPAVPPSQTHPRVAVMVVLLGANDSCSPGERQHCSPESYKTNLTQMIQWKGVRLHGTRIILVTPAPVQDHRLPHDGEGRCARIAKYAEVVRALGQEFQLPVVDLWSAMLKIRDSLSADDRVDERVGNDFDQLFTDGLHFSRQGYQVYTKELMQVLTKEEHLWEEQEWYPEWTIMHPLKEEAAGIQ